MLTLPQRCVNSSQSLYMSSLLKPKQKAKTNKKKMMNETKKSFSGGLSYQGVISQGVIAPLAIHSNLKYKTCHTHIPTFHFFRFKLDETVTLTVHLTQLFYFQNISILFSANKSKHITSNLKSLKRHKLEGGGNLIFIFSGEFLYDGIQGNVDTPLQIQNSKF